MQDLLEAAETYAESYFGDTAWTENLRNAAMEASGSTTDHLSFLYVGHTSKSTPAARLAQD